MATWVLDRIEDDRHAILVDGHGTQRVVPIGEIPAGAAEGDVLREVVIDEGASWIIDSEATERARQEVVELRRSLRRGPSGPISL
ncbi:MAG TPA: DUF3006 domain-containing protein [Longimicrobiales bacterium]|nr:DUF3006 domain-containing protein [Longimicrobiales bacterium]